MRWTARRSAVFLISLATAASGLASLRRRRRRRRADFRVFILEYHDVSHDGSESDGVINVERFRRHLRYLKRHFRITSLTRAARLLQESGSLIQDRVVLTFDDGHAGNYRSAWPILRQESVPATIFLTTGFLDGSELWFDLAGRCLEAAYRLGGAVPAEACEALTDTFGRWPPGCRLDQCVERLKYTPPRARERLLGRLREARLPLSPAAAPLSWEQVREMSSEGVEMGCHTVTHPILSTLSASLQNEEIIRSRDRIAEVTGAVPTSFAFPNGTTRDFDHTTLDLLRAACFTAACSTVRGSNRPACEPLALRRIGVGSDSLMVLGARLDGFFDEEIRRWL